MLANPFPDLSNEQEDALKINLQQWALTNGLVMYPPNFEPCQVNVAPITLFPTPIPRSCFDSANKVQKLFNELYVSLVSKEKSWLVGILAELAQFDPEFTGKLFEIYQKSIADGVLQPLSLGIFRSDYMIDSKSNEIKQIEFNTVSVSFGGLSTKIGQLHNFLNANGFFDNKYNFKYYKDEEIPVSKSVDQIAEGLADGNYHYNEDKKYAQNTIVLVVVQPNERNCFDQRLIEYSLFENHGVRSFRVTLENIVDKITENDGKIYVKETMDEISVVYYRSGYGPDDYEVNPAKTWHGRFLLEKSKAIKCPSILTQLSGSKKIQQLLTNEQIISKLLPKLNKTDLQLLLSTFVKIWPLDDSEEGKLAAKLAFEEPQNYVLKPQREGGGNNIYKLDIPDFLKNLKKEEWGAYVLMELITPQTYKNKIIRNEEIFNEDIISELGIFGTTLFSEETGDIKTNKNAGWLLRSKFETSNEGGVAAGFGCVDNIHLY
ncbi:GSH2 [Candida oxycetoniae]|uniref:Glutathione synthetase n=1 Tax=Candida oxycetoniae TaxID=497107 RepID=A0AAI9SSB6_9ASCO|nr:GSH2 [Candida oxycetoniae]KAI3402340.1 GSH2 [Candida oxycetoniae]